MSSATVEVDLTTTEISASRQTIDLSIETLMPAVEVGIPGTLGPPGPQGPPGPTGPAGPVHSVKAGTNVRVDASVTDPTVSALGPVNVTDYGAKGDGTTDDRAALLAAIAAAPTNGQVRLQPGTYLVDAAWTINKSVELVGDGATIKKGATVVSSSWLTLSASNVKLRRLVIDDSGSAVTGNLINTGSTGLSGIVVEGCTINAPAAIAVRCVTITDLVVIDNLVTACKRGIQLLGACVRPNVRNNTVRGWLDFGIYVAGDASGATTALRLIGNVVSNMTFGGSSRYPITIQQGASATVHSAVLVLGNTVLGVGKSYLDATTPGNADCFGLFGCDGLRVIGNVARDGGDMGITLDGTNAVTNAAVVGNVCRNNDTGGIAVASGAKDIVIVGNVCKNNGQNRNGARAANTRAGIYLSNGSNVAVSGNTLGDDQGTKTQLYGVNMTSCSNVSLGPDIDAGNSTATYTKNGAANTNIVKVTTAAF